MAGILLSIERLPGAAALLADLHLAAGDPRNVFLDPNGHAGGIRRRGLLESELRNLGVVPKGDWHRRVVLFLIRGRVLSPQCERPLTRRGNRQPSEGGDVLPFLTLHAGAVLASRPTDAVARGGNRCPITLGRVSPLR